MAQRGWVLSYQRSRDSQEVRMTDRMERYEEVAVKVSSVMRVTFDEVKATSGVEKADFADWVFDTPTRLLACPHAPHARRRSVLFGMCIVTGSRACVHSRLSSTHRMAKRGGKCLSSRSIGECRRISLKCLSAS